MRGGGVTFVGAGDGAGAAEDLRRDDVARARLRGVAPAGARVEAFAARLDRARVAATGRFFSVLPGLVRARLRVGVG
jgi:hypothetical protein